MAKKAIKPNIVRGGIGIPIPGKTNYYYMKGRKHKDGGIDIGSNPRTGLEVEDGEVIHLTDNNIKVFSSVPFLNGQSPAEKVMGGENPNKVFKQQEDFKDRNKLNDDGTKKAKYGKKAAVVRTPEDEKVSKLTRSYYKEVNPLAGYPSIGDAIAHGINVLMQKNVQPDSTAYAVTDKVSDATWRKRLGLSYDEKDLPTNADGSVRLPKDRELEMPIDTNLLKHRINANLKLSNKYKKQGEHSKQKIVDWAIKEDQKGLDSLRHTYKTGEPVVINEQVYNTRSLIKNGEISLPESSPLNPLQNYTLQYDKDKNVMRYRDVYDFNHLDWAVPGKGYEIKGEINLNKKIMGGDNKMDPRHAKLIARRGMPGDLEALRAAGYDKYGNPLVTFDGGKFGGSGAGMGFDSNNTTKDDSDYIRNTPILRSFSDAFAEAKRNGNSTFIFNGKKYTTKVSDNPKYVGKKYEPALNIREVLDENKKVISDSTRIEPYVGQIPGTHKRTAKAMGGKLNKPVTVTVNGKTKVVYSPSTGDTRSEAEGNRNKGKLGLFTEIDDINKYNSLLQQPITSSKVNRFSEYYVEPNIIPTVNTNIATPKVTTQYKPTITYNPNRNKNNYNRGSNNLMNTKDIISLSGNLLGSILTAGLNARSIDKLNNPIAPIPKQATKLKTKINISPLMSSIINSEKNSIRDIDANTASSRVALARKNKIRSASIDRMSNLFREKLIGENELINKDIINQQNIRNDNISAYNKYLSDDVGFTNSKQTLKSENVTSLINNVNSSLQNVISNLDKRNKDKNTTIAIMAANPNVNPKYLRDLGFDGITNKMISDWEKANKK